MAAAKSVRENNHALAIENSVLCSDHIDTLRVQAASSWCEEVCAGVFVVRDDLGMWRGNLSTDITHQSAAPYQARKVLDLTDVTDAGVGRDVVCAPVRLLHGPRLLAASAVGRQRTR